MSENDNSYQYLQLIFYADDSLRHSTLRQAFSNITFW